MLSQSGYEGHFHLCQQRFSPSGPVSLFLQCADIMVPVAPCNEKQPSVHTALERQNCGFWSREDWQIQDAFFIKPGNVAFGASSVHFNPEDINLYKIKEAG